ncbi:MAG TPA: oxygenase MpaB family protein [Actinomycetes bacterium]|nr:oxygenase MpaB family protein [Actinomycetes bacterium]
MPALLDVARVLPVNPVARTFRRIVSGDPQGRPEWIRALEDGTDAGLFGPGSAPWAVHGSTTTLIGGVRALLLQALHPAALAGVRDHSRYRDDALGRLAGTSRWLVTLTFGDSRAVERESARVRGMHTRVRGLMLDPQGDLRPYAASDPHLLRWVHLAFTDSFLVAHEVWGAAIPGGPDAYVGEWGRAAELLGLDDPPRSVVELRDQLHGYDDELDGGTDAREVARFILNPPLPLAARPAYAVLASAAVSTLEPRHRELLELTALPLTLTRPMAGALLRGLGVALGSTSPSERAARQRLDRVLA